MRLRLCMVAVALMASTAMASTELIVNGTFDSPITTGWLYGHGGWGATSDMPLSSNTSNHPWGPSSQASDPVGEKDIGCDPSGVRWIYQHFTNMVIGNSYTLSGKIAGGIGAAQNLPANCVANWTIGYVAGPYATNQIDMGPSDVGVAFTSVVRFDYTGAGAAQGFDWTTNSATFTATATEYTIFFRYFVNNSNWNYYGVYVDNISLLDLSCNDPIQITSVTPRLINATTLPTNVTLTINGSNMQVVTGATVTPAGGSAISATSITHVNNSQITAVFPLPAATAGKQYSVGITRAASGLCSPSASLANAVIAYSGLTGFLLNGDFETGTLDAWTKWGDNNVNSGVFDAAGALGIFHAGPPPVTPFPYEGTYLYNVGAWNTGGNAGIYQQVTLPTTPVNENYTVNWQWIVGTNGTGYHEVGVVPGLITDTNQLDSLYAIASVRRTDNSSGWASPAPTLTFTMPTDGKVTVYSKSGGDGNPWATFLDIMTLTDAGTQCTDPLTITNVTPTGVTVIGTPVSQQVTIDGTGLGTVNVVQLKNGATTLNPTSIDSQSATQIKATFSFPTTPLGAYNVSVSRPAVANCSSNAMIKPNAINVSCGMAPAQVNTISVMQGMAGAVASGNITGFGLINNDPGTPMLQGIKLVKADTNVAPPAEIAGVLSGLTDTTANVSCTIPAGAEGGRYNIVPIWRTDTCKAGTTIDGLTKRFLVYLPLLTNGSFEEGDVADPLAPTCDPARAPGGNNPKPKHWTMNKTPSTGGFKRDGTYGGPGCNLATNRANNITGDHYAGIDISNGTSDQNVAFFQTIDATPLLTGGLLTSDLNVRAEFKNYAYSPAGTVTATGYINVYDGTERVDAQVLLTPVVGTGTIPQTTDAGLDTSPTYVTTIPAGTPVASGTLTIEIEMKTLQAGLDTFAALWTDNVYFGNYHRPGCNRPWADLNGDQYVDMQDFALLQGCLTQATPTVAPTFECACGDADGSGVIDQSDVTSFTQCATGPYVPWTPQQYCP